MYDEATVDVSTLRRWVRRIIEAETEGAALHKKGRSGQTSTAVMRDKFHQLDELRQLRWNGKQSDCLPSSSPSHKKKQASLLHTNAKLHTSL